MKDYDYRQLTRIAVKKKKKHVHIIVELPEHKYAYFIILGCRVLVAVMKVYLHLFAKLEEGIHSPPGATPIHIRPELKISVLILSGENSSDATQAPVEIYHPTVRSGLVRN